MAEHVGPAETGDVGDPVSAEVESLSAEVQSLRDQVVNLESQVSDLERQNDELTAQATTASIQAAVASTEATHETLSWAERKQLILKQMEADTFDAEEFAESQANESSADCDDNIDPVEYVNRLNEELARREEEVRELQHLLEQQSETCDSGVSIGAAGIAEMLDSDELVREERARLQVLQDEWEEKFRKAEIEASLERAKLSRERRELSAKQSELETELERARLQTQRDSEKGAPRKWLSHLGLAGS
jgi:chromosome segregation ATPase